VNLLDAKIRDGEFKLILRHGMPLGWLTDHRSFW
jgi:hypothetical protein